MDEKLPKNGPGAQQPGQPAGQPPAPKETDDEIINKAITDLDSEKSWDVRGALDRLTKVKPNQRQAEVTRKLHKLIKSDDGSVRLAAVNAMGFWGGSEDIPTITPLLEDKDSGIRGAARKALGRLRAPLALPLLIEEIGNDHELYPIVAGYGEAAEDALLAGLNTTNIERKWYNDTGWYGAALTILGNVGTRRSIPTLERLVGLPEAGRAEPANRALTAIKNRTK
jgi:HEAT repeat protein